MILLKNLLATEREDTCKQFEHEKATETETDSVEDIINPLPLAIIKAFLATVFTSERIMSRCLEVFSKKPSLSS